MRDSRTPSCPSKCDKIFPSVWYVFQHKTQLLLWNEASGKEKWKHDLLLFSFVPLQRAPEWRLCILCVRMCHDYFKKLFLFSLTLQHPHLSSLSINSKDHDRNNLLFCQPFLHVRASLASVFWRLKPCCWEGPQCSPATTTNMDSLVQLSSFNTQLKTHFFLNLHLTGGLLLL